jgi:hypothetical protein
MGEWRGNAIDKGVPGTISTVCVCACRKSICEKIRHANVNKRAASRTDKEELCHLNRFMVSRLLLSSVMFTEYRHFARESVCG